jgi:chromosome segregation ATPase
MSDLPATRAYEQHATTKRLRPDLVFRERADAMKNELLARIAKLEAMVAGLLSNVHKAEAHAADCKRLVTAAEDDIDALRLLNREYRQDRDKAEAELAALR